MRIPDAVPGKAPGLQMYRMPPYGAALGPDALAAGGEGDAEMTAKDRCPDCGSGCGFTEIYPNTGRRIGRRYCALCGSTREMVEPTKHTGDAP